MLAIPHLDQPLDHARAVVGRLPAGSARLLWRTVLVVTADLRDPITPWFIACCGATVHVVSSGAELPGPFPDGPDYQSRARELHAALAEDTPRLDPSPLHSVTNTDPFPAPRLRYLPRAIRRTIDAAEAVPPTHAVAADLNEARLPIDDPVAAEDGPRRPHGHEPIYDTVIVDGLAWVEHDADRVLRFLHRCTRPGSLIECRMRAGEQIDPAAVEAACDRAVELGFGVRPAVGAGVRVAGKADSELGIAEPMATPADADNDASGPGGLPLEFGLVRIVEPMSDFPVEGRHHAQIMAQVQARLDIAASLVRGKEVLEAGCATGIGSRRFIAAGATRVVGLELCREALDIAREQNAVQLAEDELAAVDLRQWDLNRTPLPLDDASVDVVVCLEVLEHTVEHEAIVREFERILRPGGVLLISIPNREFEAQWNALHGFDNPFHLRVPDRAALIRLLENFDDLRFFCQANITGTLVHETTPPIELVEVPADDDSVDEDDVEDDEDATTETSAGIGTGTETEAEAGTGAGAESSRGLVLSFAADEVQSLRRRVADAPPPLDGGAFVVQPGWFQHAEGVEVIALLATKPQWTTDRHGRRRRKRARSTRSGKRPMASTLRVFEHGSNAVQYQLRRRLHVLDEDLLAERFRRWSEHQVAMGRLRDADRDLHRLRRSLDELQQTLNHSRAESARHHQAAERAVQEAARQRAALQAEVDQTTARVAEAQQQWLRLRYDLTRAEADTAFLRQQLATAGELRELRETIEAQRNDATARLEAELQSLRHRLAEVEAERDGLRQALAEAAASHQVAEVGRVERRCLDLESRVYDVEDAVARRSHTHAAAADAASSHDMASKE